MIKLFISFILFYLVEFKKIFRIKNIRLNILKNSITIINLPLLMDYKRR